MTCHTHNQPNHTSQTATGFESDQGTTESEKYSNKEQINEDGRDIVFIKYHRFQKLYGTPTLYLQTKFSKEKASPGIQ
eukprot:7512854-Ditylum_brightwellii.AAC.1